MVTTLWCKIRLYLHQRFLKWLLIRFFGEVAIIAWCSGTNTPSDIYEVKTYEDFESCTNLSEHPVHFSQDNDVEGFIVRPRLSPLVQYFVSKSQCKDGLKVSVLTNTGPGRWNRLSIVVQIKLCEKRDTCSIAICLKTTFHKVLMHWNPESKAKMASSRHRRRTTMELVLPKSWHRTKWLKLSFGNFHFHSISYTDKSYFIKQTFQ